MKNIIKVVLLFVSYPSFGQGETVILNVERVQVAKGGELSAGLFRKENFPKVGKQFIGLEKTVSGTKAQLVFVNVPVGDYGVVVFQDTDKNKLLKTNLVGFPTEPIDFSNAAKIRLGPPAFEDAKVSVKKGETLTLTITLN